MTDSDGCRTYYVLLIGNIGKRATTLNRGVVGVHASALLDGDAAVTMVAAAAVVTAFKV